ncbi:hypothetical protein HAX54_052248, partial [Datura stramonium]|nr:hypothetical protein [Datura stramonium]
MQVETCEPPWPEALNPNIRQFAGERLSNEFIPNSVKSQNFQIQDSLTQYNNSQM